MPSTRKVSANKINAQASTGPKTARGRAIASANATRHGILSQELMLPHENSADFDQLLRLLIAELGAVGTLECTLAERIAVAIWRQRRLVRAERQDIQRQNDESAAIGFSDGKNESKFFQMNDAALISSQLGKEPYVSNLGALEREIHMLPASLEMTFAQYTEAFPLLSNVWPVPTDEQASSPFANLDLCKMYGSVAERQAQWLPAILEARLIGTKPCATSARLDSTVCAR